MNVAIANRQRARKINARLLKQVVNRLLVELEAGEAELGINLVSAREMALVNETFLKHNGSTDVITFDHADKRGAQRTARPALHGELFICVDEAVLQARQFGTSWQSEIIRYIVHGVLHLLGHDDHRVATRRKMKREENRLLRGLAGKFSLAQIAGRSKISA